MPVKKPIEVGEVFGYLTAVSEGSRTGRGIYKCRCGKVLEVLKTSLRNGNTTSCGCRRVETLVREKTTHGMRGHELYGVWADMRKRCRNPESKSYPNYGGRGIGICSRWDSFVNFVADMGPRPYPGATLERDNTNGDYGPDNCCWASLVVQANNQRKSLRYTYKGADLTMRELAAIASNFGIGYATLHIRLSRGMSVTLAVETPLARVGWHPKPTDDRTSRIGVKHLYS